MKRSTVLIFVFLLLTAIMTGCKNQSAPLQEALNDYSKMVGGDLLEDLSLTIYYIDPELLTRIPVSTEDLMTFRGVKIIVVESEKLENHLEQLRKLDASMLQPVQEESYINARLYYVFEAGDSDKILEVVISEIHGSVFVNGVEVEDNPVFYDLILPFLEDEDREILGI